MPYMLVSGLHVGQSRPTQPLAGLEAERGRTRVLNMHMQYNSKSVCLEIQTRLEHKKGDEGQSAALFFFLFM